VTGVVHKGHGRIFCQLWHCGRVAHPNMRGGARQVALWPLPAEGKLRFLNREADSQAAATRCAREAGFDGVELHAANGYLHDLFLQSVSNKRIDGWGGPIENRARLILETVDAMAAAWSIERVGVRLGPSISLYGMGDNDPLDTFSYVVRELDRRRIGLSDAARAQREGS
jgi:N-ethylmaleimide reductase